MRLLHKIGGHPIIAAIRRVEDLDAALDSSVENLFFMGGTIKEIASSVHYRLRRDGEWLEVVPSVRT